MTQVAHLGSKAEPLVAEVPAVRAPDLTRVANHAVETPPNHWATPPNDSPSTPNDEGSGVTSTWWFWTIVAVVVVDGADGTYLALSSGGEPPMGTLGSVTLN